MNHLPICCSPKAKEIEVCGHNFERSSLLMCFTVYLPVLPKVHCVYSLIMFTFSHKSSSPKNLYHSQHPGISLPVILQEQPSLVSLQME